MPNSLDISIFTALESLPDKRIAVACSGGSDSMALTLLAQEWAQKCGKNIIALTVDHGLRAESAHEAARVGTWLAARAITHVILRWEGEKPRSNIQEAARNARYRLMADYCTEHGITTLLVAHTLDDQAETFLLRLRRGSGVDGLAAMQERSAHSGITLLRPLLEIRKQTLIDWLDARKQDYIFDPSNENTAYDRVKIRQFMPELEAIGLGAEKLAYAASNMVRAKTYLRAQTDAFIAEQGILYKEGYALLKTLPEAEEIAFRVISRLCKYIGGHDITPRLGEIETLSGKLHEEDFTSATLGGCIFKRTAEGILVFREPNAVSTPLPVQGGCTILWDGRFEITLAAQDCPLMVGALTQEGWLAIAREHKLCTSYPDKKILYTLPALRDIRGNIISIPHLNIGKPVDCVLVKLSS